MKKPKTAAFDAVNPIYQFNSDKVIFKDGRVGVGFDVVSAEMESWTEVEYEMVNTALLGILRTLPAGTVVQKTDIYYDRPYREDKTQQTYFEGKMNKHFFERQVLFHRSVLFLSFSPTGVKAVTRTNALNALAVRAGETVIKNPFSGLAETLEIAERAAAEFAQALGNLGGLQLKRLKQEPIRNLFLQYINLDFDGQPTRAEREISNTPGTLSLGEYNLNVVSMVGQGSDAHAAVKNGYGVTSPMLFPLTHFLQCPHILTQAFLIQDTKAELKSLDNDKKLNNSLSKLATQDNLLRVLEIDEFTAEVRAGNKQVVSLHLSCMLWDFNDQTRKENIEKTTGAFRAMFGAESVVESYLTYPLFFSLMPGCAYQIPDRWFTTSADRAACYMHWTTTYRPDPKGEFFCDRFRNLVQVNLFNTALDNQNALVIGPSGSGKSYTFGSIIVQRYEKGARQIIIDIGGSYRNVVQSLNGADFENTYFEYDPQTPIEFNPFLLPREGGDAGAWMYNDEKLNFHLALLSAIWKGGGSLDKSERTILGRFLKKYYEYLNAKENRGQTDEEYPGMQGFFEYVRHYDWEMQQVPETPDGKEALRRQYAVDMGYIQIQNFLLNIGEFTTGGRYEKVLNARRDKDLSEHRLICFDLAKVKMDPTLYPVVGMLITELALDLFRKFPDDVKYIALDEAWALLAGVLSEFIVSMYRTIRKTNGSITIITQGISEIVESSIGDALINNSSTKIILRHSNPDSLKKLQAPLGFTAHEMDLVRSCREGVGFREFFIKQGTKGKIFALEASPQLDAILSSKPVERNYLNRLVEQYKVNVPVLERDANGTVVLLEGQPVWTTRTDVRLAPAVDQFVEHKLAKSGELAA
jgi:conjugal transfer ATP-binding protein TraC